MNDTLRHVQRFERLERDIAEAGRRCRFFRHVVALAVLVPAGGLLGYWWAVAISA